MGLNTSHTTMPDTAFPLPVATLQATILAATPAQQRQMWSNAARSNAVTENPFRLHTGGPQNLIEVKTELKRGGMGDTVNFSTTNEYFNTGIQGDTPFTQQSDYEADELSNDLVKVGLVKNATSRSDYNDQTIPQEILGGTAGKLGRWMGRKEYEDAAMTHLHTAGSESKMVLGRSSVDDLYSSDEFCFDYIRHMKGTMAPNGATPVTMKKSNSENLYGYHFLTTTPAFTALKGDPVVHNMHMYAAERNANNPVFTGEVYEMDGNIIQHFCPKDHAYAGPVGSPYAPRAFLGTAITSGTGATTIKGGRTVANAAKTNAKYFRWFPLNSYTFANGNGLSAGGDIWGYGSSYFYVTIVNPISHDGGKFGIFKISANDGNQLTVSERLAASNTGIGLTQVGNVTYDSNIHALAHPLGALVYLSTSYGLPLCATPAFGAGAMRMGKGIWDNWRHQDPKAQGIYEYLYIYSVFGHACTKDFAGRTTGVLNLIHTYKMDGWNIPQR